MKPPRRPVPPAPRRRQQGAVGVVVAVTLPVVLGFIGLAIDISMLYMRNTELLQMADSTAVAAARELNGTLAGVTRARLAATTMAETHYYGGVYGADKTSFADGDSWTGAALAFSTAPSGAPWIPADSIASDAAAVNLTYAMVNTGQLNGLPAKPGLITTTLLRMVKGADSVTAAPFAVAGRISTQATPLGVCALDNTRFKAHPSSAGDELVELGYRRGITYDLLNLNPSAASPALNFIVNPIDAGSTPNHAVNFQQDHIMPFFCSGTIAYANLRAGDTVHVQPLTGTDIHDWLNSRFGDYVLNGCVREGAPPDTNIKEFMPGNSWPTTMRYAARSTPSGHLLTIAELTATTVPPLPSDVSTADYGPLWSFNKPVKYVAGSATGAKEPVPDKFAKTNWAALYPATTGAQFPASPTYPDTPYASQWKAPTPGYAYAQRRVLNLPLLDCSAPVGAQATVLGIGRFFMTSRATASSVYGEFAGLAADETLNGMVSHLQ